MNKLIQLFSVFILTVAGAVHAQISDINGNIMQRGPGVSSASCSPIVVDSLTGECTPKKGFYGNAGSATGGAIIKIYNAAGTLQVPNGGSVYSSGTITANANGSWVWKCNGHNNCPSGANNCITAGTYTITQTVSGMCESQPLIVCIGTTTTSTTPIISTTITTATTSVSGTSGASASIFLYKRTGTNYLQIGTTTATSGGSWTINSLSFSGCDTVVALASQSGSCSSAYSAYKFVTSGTSVAPVITGTYCTSSNITSVSGTSTEAVGTVITIFDNGVSEGSSTTVQNGGTWTANTGISIPAASVITAKATAPCKTISAASSGSTVIAITNDALLAVSASALYEGTGTITGNATTGNLVKIFIDGVLIGSNTAAGNSWSLTSLASNILYAGGVITVTATGPGKCEGGTVTGPTVQCILPQANLSLTASDDSICINQTVTINLNGSQSTSSYQLLMNGMATGIPVTGTDGTINLTTGSISSSGYLSIRASKIGYTGCTTLLNDSIFITVVVPAAPVISITGSVYYCEGDTIILKSSYANSNIWSTGATADSIVVVTSGNYTVTYTNALGCTSSQTQNINLTSLPSQPVISGPVLIGYCYGDSVLLSTSYTPGLLYQWRRFGNSIPDADTTFYTLTSPGKYRVRVTDINGCTNISNFYEVIATGPMQPNVIANGLTNICTGQSVMLMTDIIPGITFTWRKFGNSIPGATGISYNATTPGIYSCVATNIYGCTNVSAPIEITSAASKPVVSSPLNNQICQGSSVSLSVIQEPNTTYQWKKYNGIIAGSTASTYLATSEGQYRCVATNTNGCSSVSDIIYVTITPQKPVITPSGTIGICAGDSVMLSTSAITGVNYSWKKYNNTLPFTNNNFYYATNAGKYKCIITDQNGCTNISDPVTVQVNCKTSQQDIYNKVKTKIFPSPSNGNFTILTENFKGFIEIKISDLQGGKTDATIKQISEGMFEVINLPGGIYVTSIISEGHIYNLRTLVTE